MKLRLILCKNSINYKLNKNNYNAKVVKSPKASGHVIIPNSIKYQSDIFEVTKIDNDSFRYNCHIKSIDFPKSSKISIFHPNIFYMSTIQKVVIPSSLEKLNKGWCKGTPYLTSISISPLNKNFTFIDSDIILGKSQSTETNYNVLLFCRRDIESIIIPSFVKIIEPYSFQFCEDLKSVLFADDSELVSINEHAFENSSISTIDIPKKVKKISKCAFNLCQNLNYVNFFGKMKKIKIDKSAFRNSPFEKEFIKKNEQIQISDTTSISQDIVDILNKNEKKQINLISSHFIGISPLSVKNYYSLFNALSIFSSEKGSKRSIERCIQSGVLPSLKESIFFKKKGTIILINKMQIEYLIGISSSTLEKFLNQFSFSINVDDMKNILKKNGNLLKRILSYYEIICKLGYSYDIYFLLSPPFKYDYFPMLVFNPLSDKKSPPNNKKFLIKWQDNNKLKQEINQDEDILKKYKENLCQLYNLIEMIEQDINQINSSEENQNNTENNSHVDINKLSDEDSCEFAFFLIAKLKELKLSISENFVKKESFIQDKLNHLKKI